VQHKGKPGGAFDLDDERGRIMRELAPECAEPVVQKSLPNAFAQTDFAEKLEAAGRKQLIVTGFMTHMCVSSTARAALDHGYRVTIPASTVGHPRPARPGRQRRYEGRRDQPLRPDGTVRPVRHHCEGRGIGAGLSGGPSGQE